MLVAIAGGHGKIALHLARMLSADGDAVRSMIRRPEHAGDVREAGGEPVECDLEAADVDAVAAAIDGVDAVVFAAGAGPGSGAARKETMDYGGAVKLVHAAKQAGVARYVIVSSRGADADAAGDDTFAVYLRAKGRADADLAASGLDYTVVRPGGLTDEPGTGRVRIEADGDIPREDVAAMLIAVLREPRTVGLTFELVGGDVPISDAVAALIS